MNYIPSNQRLHDFNEAPRTGSYERPLPEDTYVLPRVPVFSSRSNYSGGLRAGGMDAQSYIAAIAGARGYKAPQMIRGDYNQAESSGRRLNFPTISLSSLRGTGTPK
ncbi:hypothetical protein FJZ18_01225 [Candidatus Pacearchaeota archaeon]|nr:hypothetical protein [Candidatus Pacearchaeota archaeon]